MVLTAASACYLCPLVSRSVPGQLTWQPCQLIVCLAHVSFHVVTIGSYAVAALGSTNNFELPAEELEKFTQDHSMNGGGAASNSTEDDEDDYTESLVYVSSPKVGYLHCTHACRSDRC